MKRTLYYAPIACSLVSLISLDESGADFEVKPVNMRKAEQMKPEYLRMNPKHKVPVLLIDGKPLTENVATALWMTRAFPKAGILPAASDGEGDLRHGLVRIGHPSAPICAISSPMNSGFARASMYCTLRK